MSNNQHLFYHTPLPKKDYKLLYISTSKFEGDWKSHLHMHYFTEIFYILNGEGTFLIENNLIPAQKNDLIIINPNVEHTENSIKMHPLEYIVFGVDGLTFQFDELTSFKDYILLNYSNEKDMFLLLLHTLLKEISQKRNKYESVCQNILEIFLIYISRHEKLNIINSLTIKMPKECSIIKRYLDYNYSDNITLDTLANLTHMNKYYLVHSFTKYIGISPIHYLTSNRVQASKNLLLTTNYSIAEIASNVGFSSQSYFSYTFRKLIGISPNEYRKQYSK